ncbi:MAG: CrcB family protein [Candidatus Ancillula sp.]|jgi:fluoride ion exporter CrcB/FEX|nr:CrcB family protein [Candidatus Ancillula sp.]
MNLFIVFVISLCGGLGAISRFGCDQIFVPFFQKRLKPNQRIEVATAKSTLAINCLACFIMGICWISLDSSLQKFFVFGFCGGFSTMSAWAIQLNNLPLVRAVKYFIYSYVFPLFFALVGAGICVALTWWA